MPQSADVDSIVTGDLLYDFYSDLLTDHQKRIFEKVTFDDCSLSEVAREEGISRQGVSDLLRRVDAQLKGYESKLGLVKRFLAQRKEIREIRRLSGEFLENGDKELVRRIVSLSEHLLNET